MLIDELEQNNGRFSFSEDASICCTKELMITHWSKSAEMLFGYKEEEILGTKLHRLVPDHKISEIEMILKILEQEETIKSYESVRKNKNGNYVPVGISVAPLYDYIGKFSGVFAQYRDISDKIQLLNQLKSMEELWRSAIQSGNFGVWEWHIDTNKFVFHNQWYNTLALNIGEVENTYEDWLRFVHKEDVPILLNMIETSLQGMEYICEYRMLTKNGRYIWIREKGEVKEWDEMGNPSKMIGTHEEITDRKLIEEQLADKCRQLEKTNIESEITTQAKTSFLACISHEIRTPMNGIIGIIQLLKRTKLDQKQLKWLNLLQEAVDSQMNIINNMLYISKIEAGKIELENCLFNMKTLVIEVYDQLLVLCKPKRLEAKLFFDRKIQHMVIGDKFRIKQILLNLINNASKFTDHGSISIEVRLLSSEEDKECIEVKITDTGIGILPQDKEKIFESYYQGNLSAKKKHMGTGLGLAISKQLALLMDGDIEVDSILGKGSTFRFYCYLSKYRKTTKAILEVNKEQGCTTFLQDKISFDRNMVRDEIILSVEDNEINQEIIEAVVKNCGFHLLTANNGEEALMQMKKYQVDIVLMDIQLPDMDGYELTRVIRENDSFKAIPIIGMTACAMEAERKRCLETGMSDFIAKPIDMKQFINTICKYID
jgi:PAS domain S-box-containing protein